MTNLLIALAVGLVAVLIGGAGYLVAVRFIPGKQPGENLLDPVWPRPPVVGDDTINPPSGDPPAQP